MIINKDEFLKAPKKYRKALRNNVFVYPTDTMYCIGCDATNKELVGKVRNLKKSSVKPFSIIPPSKAWVEENCEYTDEQEKFVDHLESPKEEFEDKTITLILNMKEGSNVANNVNSGNGEIGIRIFNHWFMEEVKQLGFPVLYTSANPVGGDLMTDLESLSKGIKNKVNLVIYEGEKKGNPSMIVNK